MKRKSIIAVTILLLTIGFAAISTTLIINGSTKVGENTDDFSVIFTAASLDGTDVYTNVISEDKKTINFSTNDLKSLNQTSVLNYEVTNNSSNYDAEVVVNCKVKENTTAKYTSIKNELKGNATVIKAKTSLNGTLTVTLEKSATEEVREEYVCTLTLNAVERDTLGAESIPDPVSFSEDSWKTIQKAVQTGNTDKYNVGDTKKITIASHINDCVSANEFDDSNYKGEDYKCESREELEKQMLVRISNKSECTNGETSETACGFVVEFVDIIENHNYNSADATNEYGTNMGGWKDSELRAYINDTLYHALPNDLQSVIATTKVISGHGGTAGETNFETQDKLYLLSMEEIYEDAASSNHATWDPSIIWDTSVGTSKQLDYYKNQGVTKDNYSSAKKQYDGKYEGAAWWFRSMDGSDTENIIVIYDSGDWDCFSAGGVHGISPAFRIA